MLTLRRPTQYAGAIGKAESPTEPGPGPHSHNDRTAEKRGQYP